MFHTKVRNKSEANRSVRLCSVMFVCRTFPGLSEGTIWKKIVSPTILSSSSVETIEKLASVKYSRSNENTPVAAVPACAALFVTVA